MLFEVNYGRASVVLHARARLLLCVNIVVVLERGQAPFTTGKINFKEAAVESCLASKLLVVSHLGSFICHLIILRPLDEE